jgi:hypothetical protein
LPAHMRLLKSRTSSRVGFIHLIEINDYERLCATLVTPKEIGDYLKWRTSICTTHPLICSKLNEKALVGQFLAGENEVQPESSFGQFVDRLSGESDWQAIFGILHKFGDRLQPGSQGNDYYLILKELAKLKRGMMGKFVERYKWAMQECKRPSVGLPSRMSIPGNDCSFIFIPLDSKSSAEWAKTLESQTTLSKYDFKTKKAIGLTISSAPDSDSEYLINWCYLECAWEEDRRCEEFLKSHYPFRRTMQKRIPHYEFTAD